MMGSTQTGSLIGKRRGTKQTNSVTLLHRRLPCSTSSSSILSWLLVIFVIFYVFVAGFFFAQHNTIATITTTTSTNNNNHHHEKKYGNTHEHPPPRSNDGTDHNSKDHRVVKEIPAVAKEHKPLLPPTTPRRYDYWKDIAVQLAGRTADEILNTLEHDDPFGVRQFERDLLQEESNRRAILDVADLATIFPCPIERITLPDQRDPGKGQAFRESISNSARMNVNDTAFLFFQHLRKAGGTNFCTLAEKNLHKQNIPSYYCMPDMNWSGRRCAGCLTKFDNDEIIDNMRHDQHLILGNEWDPFATRFLDLPAIFATSFRRPLDRALSQFRFECIEDRGCKIKKIEDWWAKRKDLTNVYTWTFSRHPIYKISRGQTESDSTKRQAAMTVALDNVIKFNLVMVMEWLAYAPNHVSNVLGFRDTSTLTTRVRPHIAQFQRNDGQEKNVLGAAGIAKASWTPKDYLSPEQYKIMSEDLALDEILTDAARRMFLERIVCSREDYIEAA